MGIFSDGASRDDYLHLEARVTSLEAAVAQLSAALAASSGVPAPGSVTVDAYAWLPEVRALKARHKIVDAVKVVREHTGWDLRTSKDYVDRL